MPDELRRCLKGMSLSLLAALPCVLLGRWLLPHTTSRVLVFAELAVVGAVAASASAFAVPGFRRTLKENALRLVEAARPRMT